MHGQGLDTDAHDASIIVGPQTARAGGVRKLYLEPQRSVLRQGLADRRAQGDLQSIALSLGQARRQHLNAIDADDDTLTEARRQGECQRFDDDRLRLRGNA